MYFFWKFHLFIWAIFFLSWRTCYVKGWSLRCSPGQGNSGCCAVMLYVGQGPRGSNGTCSTLCWISVTSLATCNQIGPLWCWFPSGWACAHYRPLWVSPTNSPVRLGISPAAASTPTGVINQRFEALFPHAGAMGCEVCFSPAVPPGLSVHQCGAAGAASHHFVGSGSCSLACPIPQSATSLGPLAAALPRVLSTPAAHLRPSYQSGLMFLLYLLGCQTSVPFDFLSVLVVFCF